MGRKINCSGCNMSMGEIRDASLRKGIRYLCKNCNEARVKQLIELTKLKRRRRPSSPLDDLLGGDFKI